jgi:hypothetical protein
MGNGKAIGSRHPDKKIKTTATSPDKDIEAKQGGKGVNKKKSINDSGSRHPVRKENEGAGARSEKS